MTSTGISILSISVGLLCLCGAVVAGALRLWSIDRAIRELSERVDELSRPKGEAEAWRRDVL